MPTPELVREYLLGGHDGVFNFHHSLGAELSQVIPGGRPEDKSSCGYTLLLHYPTTEVEVTLGAPVSRQLIEVVRMLARNIGAEVTAISRPGGLASYLAARQ